MDQYSKAASQIIKEQQSIIGPLAIDQAKKVEGLQVAGTDEIKITGNGKDVLSKLVNQYAQLFGQASVEACKDAVRGIIADMPKEQVPAILQ